MPSDHNGPIRRLTDLALGALRPAAASARPAPAAPPDHFTLAAQGANDGLWDWDLATGRVAYSRRWAEMLGSDVKALAGRAEDWLDRVHPADAQALRLAIDALIEGSSQQLEHEQRLRLEDGSYRWMLVRAVALRDAAGRALRIAGSQTDVTDRHWQREQLEYDAFHDGLTGLPNRALFLDRLGQAVALGRRRNDPTCAVLSIDIDRFKLINDSLGHGAGDEFLTILARRLESCLKEGDTLARMGGDEFAILTEQAGGLGQVMGLAERIRGILASPIVLDDQEIFTSVCVGIAVTTPRMRHADDLLRDANLALYRAKATGVDRVEVFDQGLHARAVKRLRMENELRRAIERDELDVHYQPVVALDTGRIVGFEALARWQRAERGPVSPAEFIPLAEETGLIGALGKKVLNAACAQLQEWQRRGLVDADVSMNVNVSAKQFAQTDLVAELRDALATTALSGNRLKLEITESVIMENPELAASILDQVRQLGVGLCVDDFGTGYSSLSYLHRFPINTIKIDRVFSARIANGGPERTLIKSIIKLGLALGLDVVAEGVETEEQRRELLKLNCRFGQGYLFAPPLPADQAASLLSAGPAIYPPAGTKTAEIGQSRASAGE